MKNDIGKHLAFFLDKGFSKRKMMCVCMIYMCVYVYICKTEYKCFMRQLLSRTGVKIASNLVPHLQQEA